MCHAIVGIWYSVCHNTSNMLSYRIIQNDNVQIPWKVNETSMQVDMNVIACPYSKGNLQVTLFFKVQWHIFHLFTFYVSTVLYFGHTSYALKIEECYTLCDTAFLDFQDTAWWTHNYPYLVWPCYKCLNTQTHSISV